MTTLELFFIIEHILFIIIVLCLMADKPNSDKPIGMFGRPDDVEKYWKHRRNDFNSNS